MKITGKIWLATLACLPPAVALAQGTATGLKAAGGTLGSLGKQGVGLSSSLGGIAGTALSGGFYLIGTIFLGLMIYGGFVWLKAAGRDEEIGRAKKIIIAAIVGMVILLASYGITNFILDRLAGKPLGGGAFNPSTPKTPGIGCCHSTDLKTGEPISQDACGKRGTAFFWTSNDCSP